MTTKPSKEEIWAILTRPDDPLVDHQDQRGMHAIGRALIALSNRRTFRHTSLIMVQPCGFSSMDEDKGMSMSKFYADHGYLTPRQVKWWLLPSDKGVPRICKYWEQLQIAAQDKSRRIDERRRRFLTNQRDLFDSDEVLMDRAEIAQQKRDEQLRRMADRQIRESRWREFGG